MNIISLRTGDMAGVRTDRVNGVLYNASVITGGPASGHGFVIDDVMLNQVLEMGNSHANGLKVRFTHPELAGGMLAAPMVDEIEVLLGRAKNFRKDGNQIKADIFFGKYAARPDGPKGNMRDYLLDIAEDDPTAIGLSIKFAKAKFEKSGENLLGRVAVLHAVDFVGDAGANPGGLLSQGGSTMIDPKLRKHLESVGLSKGSSDQDTLKYLMELKPAQFKKARAVLLAEGDVIVDPEAVVDVEAPIVIPDITPEALETEEQFKARFVADSTMMEKYPDEVSRQSRANDIWAEKAAEEAAVVPEPEIVTDPAAVVVPEEALSAKQIQEQFLTSDKNRRANIAMLGKKNGMEQAFCQSLADSGVTTVMFQEIVKKLEGGEPVSRTKVGDDLNLSTLGDGISDAISLRSGLFSPRKLTDGEFLNVGKPCERANGFKHMSLLEIGREYLCQFGIAGREIPKTEVVSLCFNKMMLSGRAKGNMAFLAMSTSDFPFILANVLNKSLRQSYEITPITWNMWAKETTAADFKQVSKVLLSAAPDLAQINEGGEYTYGKLTENREVYSLAKYGKGLKFTREMMINDDLSAFSTIMQKMGAKAKYLEDQVAYAILTNNANLSDGNAIFDRANHNNDFVGNISVATLAPIMAAMGTQTDIDGSTLIGNDPRHMIVPKGREVYGRQFLTSVNDPDTDLNPLTPNPFAGFFNLIASPHLDQTSSQVWYLAADPNQVDTVDVCFLEGEREPVLEEETDFDTDAKKFKVRHQIVAKAIDYRGLVRVSGDDTTTTT